MPKRKRHKEAQRSSPAETRPAEQLDPLSQFGLLLIESAKQEQAEQERRQRQRDEARAAQRAKQQHAEDLAAARRQLEEAIEDVRRARHSGRGRAEADAAWRAAKATVIELETGEAPAWAPPKPIEDDAPADTGAPEATDEVTDAPGAAPDASTGG